MLKIITTFNMVEIYNTWYIADLQHFVEIPQKNNIGETCIIHL